MVIKNKNRNRNNKQRTGVCKPKIYMIWLLPRTVFQPCFQAVKTMKFQLRAIRCPKLID